VTENRQSRGGDMKRRDDPKIQAVTWFFGFIADDLDHMSVHDFNRLFLDAMFYYMKPPLRYQSQENLNLPTKPRDSRMGGILNADEVVEWKTKFKEVQANLKNFLEGILKCEDRLNHVSQVSILCGVQDGKIRTATSLAYPEPFTEDQRWSSSRLTKLAQIRLSEFLDEISLDDIGACPECGKYFLRLSKKPKFYCDSKCTSRAMSRKRRESSKKKGERTKTKKPSSSVSNPGLQKAHPLKNKMKEK
jgi:hypothetical protein